MSTPQHYVFVDRLRIALVSLVVVHHVGQAYGPTGGFWYFTSAERASIIGPLFAIDRSFFMSLFFMLSGYFLPGSFERNGARTFLRDRLVRFGIPLLAFLLLINSFQAFAYYLYFRPYPAVGFWDYWWHTYLGFGPKPADWSGPSWPERNFGHLWYVEHLLLFSIVYAAWRKLRPYRPAASDAGGQVPDTGQILAFALLLVLASAIVRIWYPIDRWVAFLGFIQVAFADVPRDLSFFLIGIAAYRNNWLFTFPREAGRRWLWVGIGLAVLYYALRLLGLFPFRVPLVYPVWETLLCLGMCIGLTATFRDLWAGPSHWAERLCSCTYGVYLFHVPIVVGLQFAFASVAVGPFAKFLIVSVLAIPLTFLLTDTLRRVPVMRRVL